MLTFTHWHTLCINQYSVVIFIYFRTSKISRDTNIWYCPKGSFKKEKITSFVLYFNTTYQTVSFLTNFDKFCPLQRILLHVLSFSLNPVRFSC
ncbi:hypothetical protein Hanom_Chr00s000003g01605191 [Helianthus anomalus]